MNLAICQQENFQEDETQNQNSHNMRGRNYLFVLIYFVQTASHKNILQEQSLEVFYQIYTQELSIDLFGV